MASSLASIASLPSAEELAFGLRLRSLANLFELNSVRKMPQCHSFSTKCPSEEITFWAASLQNTSWYVIFFNFKGYMQRVFTWEINSIDHKYTGLSQPTPRS